MSSLKQRMVPYITEEEITGMVSDLALRVQQDYAGKDLVVVCPLKGSAVFCSDLVRQVQLPLEVEFVHLTSPKKESVRIHKDISTNILGKHVLIVETIIDAGRTLNFLRDRILASHPASLKIMALIDKPSRRELPIGPDYVGRTIDDRFIIGYGLDSEELGRNYKDIYNYAQ